MTLDAVLEVDSRAAAAEQMSARPASASKRAASAMGSFSGGRGDPSQAESSITARAAVSSRSGNRAANRGTNRAASLLAAGSPEAG